LCTEMLVCVNGAGTVCVVYRDVGLCEWSWYRLCCVQRCWSQCSFTVLLLIIPMYDYCNVLDRTKDINFRRSLVLIWPLYHYPASGNVGGYADLRVRTLLSVF